MKVEVTVIFQVEIGEQPSGVEVRPVSTRFDNRAIGLVDQQFNPISAIIAGHETSSIERIKD